MSRYDLHICPLDVESLRYIWWHVVIVQFSLQVTHRHVMFTELGQFRNVPLLLCVVLQTSTLSMSMLSADETSEQLLLDISQPQPVASSSMHDQSAGQQEPCDMWVYFLRPSDLVGIMILPLSVFMF